MPSAEPAPTNHATYSDADATTPPDWNKPKTGSSVPSKAVLQKVADFVLSDADGRDVTFKSLYWAEPGKTRQVLIVFIRHFFCGNCQEYVRSLNAQIPPSSLDADTSIVIIGCGSHTLIPSYLDLTSSSYPIYADPTKRLFALLGMQRSLSLGRKGPDYIQHTLAAGMMKSIVQGVRRIGAGDVMKAGDMRQNGGEFVLEVSGADQRSNNVEIAGETKGNRGLGNVQVTFCHRMQNSRDHTEIPQLARLLGVNKADERSRRRAPRLERRWTSGGSLGNLARSLSSRSWSRPRRREQSESGTHVSANRKKSAERMFETVREDVKSRDGENAAGPAANLTASSNMDQVVDASHRFSFTEDKRHQAIAA